MDDTRSTVHEIYNKVSRLWRVLVSFELDHDDCKLHGELDWQSQSLDKGTDREIPVYPVQLSCPYSEALWQYGWPPLCMMGLVGNTLVLLVLRRDGLVRTSANVYLSALAVGDSLVLMVASVAACPMYGWRWFI